MRVSDLAIKAGLGIGITISFLLLIQAIIAPRLIPLSQVGQYVV